MFDGRWRTSAERALRPVGATLQRTGLKADHLTATGLVAAGGCAVAVATGHTTLGVALLAASAIPDVLDGAVAKASGTASPRGAFFDSVADRVSDALILGGIAWHLSATRGGQLSMLAMAALGLSMLISYERAKAESLGYDARGGLMERAERLAAIAVGLAFPALLVPVLVLLVALTGLTAVQRFAKVWRQAGAPPAPVTPLRPARHAATRPVAVRLRAWRERAAARPLDAATVGERWRARRAESRALSGRRSGAAWRRSSRP